MRQVYQLNAEKMTHMSQGSDEHIPHIEPTLKRQHFKQRQHRVANVVKVKTPRVGPRVCQSQTTNFR